MLWWWATPFTVQCGVSFQCKLATHIKCLIKHIWFTILLTISISTSSLYKLVCQQQDKPAVSYTKNFTHYFEICFIILFLTHQFIPSDDNSLTLTNMKILQASIFHLDLSMSFLVKWVCIHCILSSIYILLFFFHSYFPNLFFSLNGVIFAAFFSRAQIQPLELEHKFNILQLWEAGSLTLHKGYCLMKTALHLLLNNTPTKNIPRKT